MARYLLAVSAIPGHVAPMVVVAEALRRRGHDVHVLTGAAFRAEVTARGLAMSALPVDAEVAPVGSRRGPGAVRRWRIGRAELRSVFLAPLAAQHAALVAALARADFDVVLVDSMFTGAIPLLMSERPRPPVVVCGVGPLTLSSADCAPFGVGRPPWRERDHSRMNWFVRQVLFRADQARLDTILHGHDLPSAPVFLLDWPRLADRLLQFTVPGFEYPRRDLPASVVFTGPIPSAFGADRELPAWWSALDGQRLVVHVTQGTWDNRDLDQLLRPTLAALGGRSDVLIVAGTGGSPASVGPLPANAVACDFVPYSRLLPHVDVMITNGGYGGVQQVLRHGIPLIVAGDTADKPEVAARVAYTGAGINLGGASPSPSAVAAAFDRIVRDNSFRAAAGRLAAEMARHSPFETITAVLDEVGLSAGTARRPVSAESVIAIPQRGETL
ncbi:glycosyltransferase [Nocardia sp. NPDC006044]|uniref:glycosyltransferase n=1 Tax=Nocardia sp. NPDC006044 TaxID=3364306 RepID=UPI0036A1F8B0